MESITVKIKCRAIKRTLGLLDHYFLEIGTNEYHLGFYRKGKILPLGTTRGAHTVLVRSICTSCYDRLTIMLEYAEDVRLTEILYPLVNCETLTTGISIQLGTLMCTLPFFFWSLLHKTNVLYALIVLLIALVCILWHSKFVYSRTLASACIHLQ